MWNVHYQQKYVCFQCGKLFRRPDNLKKHTRVHHGVRKVFISDKTETICEDLVSIKELSDVDKERNDDNSGSDDVSMR